MIDRARPWMAVLVAVLFPVGCSAGEDGTGSGGAGNAGGTAGAAAGGSGAGGSGAAGGVGTGGSGAAGGGTGDECDPGTTTTEWATGCATSAPACVPGTWKAPGSTTGDPLGLESEHFAFYWPAGESHLASAQQMADVLENIVWTTFMGAPILFPEPYCGSPDKYKVSVVIHSDWGLTGGGWGNGYMGMWIGPGAAGDHWGLAHEFTHALQASTGGLQGSPYTGWLWESHANWHAHQLPEYHGESVHCSELLVNFPHLYLGSTRDRYCNWQFLEYLKDRYCHSAVESLWSEAPESGPAQKSADPFGVLAANMGWSASDLGDFFGEWAMHNVTWDYRNPDGTDEGALYRARYGATSDTSGHAPGAPEGFRRLRNTVLDPLDLPSRRFVTPSAWAPQRFGYNLVRLFPDPGATEVRITFRGVLQDGPANADFGPYANQPASIPEPSSDWRWGLVAVDAGGTKPRYSQMQRGSDGELTFCLDPAESELWLVVTATPADNQQILWDQMYYTIYRYPWMAQIDGAMPSGYQQGAPTPTPDGQTWPNGGGWVASGATVAPSVYVGPGAMVLGGTVSGNARIEDHAVIVNGNVSGDAVVGALSVVSGGLTVKGAARVETVFQGPGTFEGGQVVSSTGQILGDVELRGRGLNVSAGVFYGFIDPAVTADPAQGANRTAPVEEVTAPPPYVWRP